MLRATLVLMIKIKLGVRGGLCRVTTAPPNPDHAVYLSKLSQALLLGVKHSWKSLCLNPFFSKKLDEKFLSCKIAELESLSLNSFFSKKCGRKVSVVR